MYIMTRSNTAAATTTTTTTTTTWLRHSFTASCSSVGRKKKMTSLLFYMYVCCVFSMVDARAGIGGGSFPSSTSSKIWQDKKNDMMMVNQSTTTTRCATSSPPRWHQLVDHARILHYQRQRQQQHPQPHHRRKLAPVDCNTLCQQCVEIPVYFHFMALADDDNGNGNGNDDGFVLPHPLSVIRQLIDNDNGNDNDNDNINMNLMNQEIRKELTSYDEMVNNIIQTMEVLNEGFQKTPFRFALQSNPTTTNGKLASVTINNDWTNRMLQFGQEMVSLLGQGKGQQQQDDDDNDDDTTMTSLQSLNVYLSYRLGGKDMTTDAVGIATFPSFQGSGSGDGIWMTYSRLKGGFPSTPQLNLGYTLVHEVGHWLGLYHTFENSVDVDDICSEDNLNDFVDDTGILDGPTRSSVDCQALIDSPYDPPTLDPDWPDTCPNNNNSNNDKLVDPIFNYMNYLDDERCYQAMGEFTCGQIERMWWQWILYRQTQHEDELLCPNNDEFPMELTIVFDNAYHERDNNRFYIITTRDLTTTTTKEMSSSKPITTTSSSSRQQQSPSSSLSNNLQEDEESIMIFDSFRDHDDEFVLSYVQRSIVIDLCLSKNQEYVVVVQDLLGDGLGPDGSVTLNINGGGTGGGTGPTNGGGGIMTCVLDSNFGVEGRIPFTANSITCNDGRDGGTSSMNNDASSSSTMIRDQGIVVPLLILVTIMTTTSKFWW